MLIEVKVKVTRIDGKKYKKSSSTYILDRELFSQAEYTIMQMFEEEIRSKLVSDYEIVSMRCSPIKELATQYSGKSTFVATLKDVFTDDDGNEKPIRYKVLLWADSLPEAMSRTAAIVRQGYDMTVEGLKEVDYEYLSDNEDEI